MRVCRFVASLDATSGSDIAKHERISPALGLHEVEVALQLETRGADHAELVVTRLRECGYRVSVGG